MIGGTFLVSRVLEDLGTKWEFSKTKGLNLDLKIIGSYYKDTPEMEPNLT